MEEPTPTLSTIDFDLPCSQCQYDLRGLNEDGRCPECGQHIWTSNFAHQRRLNARWTPLELDSRRALLSLRDGVIYLLMPVIGFIAMPLTWLFVRREQWRLTLLLALLCSNWVSCCVAGWKLSALTRESQARVILRWLIRVLALLALMAPALLIFDLDYRRRPDWFWRTTMRTVGWLGIYSSVALTALIFFQLAVIRWRAERRGSLLLGIGLIALCCAIFALSNARFGSTATELMAFAPLPAWVSSILGYIVVAEWRRYNGNADEYLSAAALAAQLVFLIMLCLCFRDITRALRTKQQMQPGDDDRNTPANSPP